VSCESQTPHAASRSESMLCPSAQPEMVNSVVLGVVTDSAVGQRLAYLEEPQPVTERLLALTGDIPPTQILRFAARCEESTCAHYDGQRCQLASRIVEHLPSVVDILPLCKIRPECRWFGEHGAAACRRCPQVVTYLHSPSDLAIRVAVPSAQRLREASGGPDVATGSNASEDGEE
jgi:hypothetical protein